MNFLNKPSKSRWFFSGKITPKPTKKKFDEIIRRSENIWKQWNNW